MPETHCRPKESLAQVFSSEFCEIFNDCFCTAVILVCDSIEISQLSNIFLALGAGVGPQFQLQSNLAVFLRKNGSLVELGHQGFLALSVVD